VARLSSVDRVAAAITARLPVHGGWLHVPCQVARSRPGWRVLGPASQLISAAHVPAGPPLPSLRLCGVVMEQSKQVRAESVVGWARVVHRQTDCAGPTLRASRPFAGGAPHWAVPMRAPTQHTIDGWGVGWHSARCAVARETPPCGAHPRAPGPATASFLLARGRGAACAAHQGIGTESVHAVTPNTCSELQDRSQNSAGEFLFLERGTRRTFGASGCTHVTGERTAAARGRTIGRVHPQNRVRVAEASGESFNRGRQPRLSRGSYARACLLKRDLQHKKLSLEGVSNGTHRLPNGTRHCQDATRGKSPAHAVAWPKAGAGRAVSTVCVRGWQ
jgi:hypothetical protein